MQVEVTLGNVPKQETPLEIEHRLYLGVREQVTDLEQDPNVQFCSSDLAPCFTTTA